MHAATIINKGSSKIFDALGPTVEFLTSPVDPDSTYCIIKGTIPPRHAVPLHSHPDEESFYILSGGVEAMVQNTSTRKWILMGVGDFVHIPSNIKHAWRNDTDEAVEGLIVTTLRLGKFFQEIARPVAPGEHLTPTPGQLQQFMKVAARYNHWLASPDENASIGIF